MDRSTLGGRRIVIGVGGGIAAYKACDLVRELRRAGATVRVAMTEAATKFVTPLTFQALSGENVLTNYFDTAQEAQFGHLHLARWAELFVVAPATADVLSRISAGMANDAVTTSLLAFRGPVLLAPAMNVVMWKNEITQQNLEKLKKYSRFLTVGPGVGPLADGDVGPGRLAEVGDIVDAAAQVFSSGPLSGKRVLITAGPTREFLDPVRFVSNPSTGKMGLALAHEARKLGAKVTVVLGPIEQADRQGLEVIDVVSAEDMAQEVLSRVMDTDFLVATAAVSDYRAAEKATQKKKKSANETWNMVRTPDVLAEAAQRVQSLPTRPLLIGFAAETERVLEHALKKLHAKNLDAIVANDVTLPDAGFGVDTNRVTLLWKSGHKEDFEGSKTRVAQSLWKAILQPRISSFDVKKSST